MRLTEGMEIDGRYRLRYRAGSGGMADVWVADDSHLNRQVALKVLHERFAQDRDFVERFRREASAAAGLQHPNVVAVFDRGEVEGTYYIAMEYVEGPSLKELISRGLSIEQSLEITRQLLDAAQIAHQGGIVHRDIKPQNILIDNEGRVRVTDFGVAKADASSEITQAGEVVGTATYFSPEQAQGLDVGPAGDIYSIGIVLYEMLTGRPPFEGDTSVAVAIKHVGDQPEPPSRLNPAVPHALDGVVLRALAKSPANRYASAAEFAEALRLAKASPHATIEQTLTHTALPPLPPARTGAWRWVAGTLAVIALLAFVVWSATRGEDVIVPTVIAEAQEVATDRLIEEGFEVSATSVTDDSPAGRVIEQDPPAGTQAEEGSLVTITVSLGPGVSAVPDVRGKTEKAAVAALRKAGFEVRSQSVFSTGVKEGRVVRSSPPVGTRIAKGDEVTLLVSEGTQLVGIPSVVGLQREVARGELRSAGFIPNVETRDSDEPEGEVIEQVPGAGEQAERGDQVTIVVSTGAGSVVLPDVIGQVRESARETLQELGVRVLTETIPAGTAADDGRVIDQAPGPQTRVHAGDPVTIFIGRFSEPRPEPEPEPEPEPDSDNPPG